MAYLVSLTAIAEADASTAFERIRAVAPTSAAQWLTGLFAAIPERWPTCLPVVP
jgi:hypothetical protein